MPPYYVEEIQQLGSTTDRLNARFVKGQPTDNLFAAGVLIHQFDGMEDTAKPWLPCGQAQWCAKFRDRISASMLNARSAPGPSGPIPVFSEIYGGLIFAPGVARVMCSYAGDGGTMRKLCDPPGLSEQCVPGCGHGSMRPGPWTGSMRKGELKSMLKKQETRLEQKPYNELVIDPSPCIEQPGEAIEAVFFIAGSACRADSRCYQYSKQVRDDFVASTGVEIPLVELNPYNWRNPFREEAS